LEILGINNKKELRQIVKDTIVMYCNKKDYEFKDQYDWDSMKYQKVKAEE
jgi:hypothetical protein